MPVAVMLPNVEKLVSTFLQTDTDMIAVGTPALAGRVYTAIPNSPTFPLVRVTQFDDIKITQRPLWVVQVNLQIEAWGGSNYDAWHIAATAQSVLAERLVGVHTDGVVCGVQFGSLRNAPDTDYQPAKPRRIFTAQITAHP